MWSKSLCLLAAATMVFAFCVGCEEETVEKKPTPAAEKVEAKPPAAKPEAKPAVPAPAPKAEEKKPAPAPKPEAKAPAKKTEVTVAKTTSLAPTKAEPAPAAKEPAKTVEAEKKVSPPKPPAPPAVGSGKAEESVWVVDDFEQGNNYWIVESWANPAKLSIENGALKIALGEGKSDKSAIARSANLDLSDRSKLILDVKNETSKDVKVAAAFQTGGAPTYYETDLVTVKPGMNKNVTFDLKSEKFKSAATNWENKMGLSDANAVKRVIILVYGDNNGEVCLDNIRFEK